MFDAMFNEKKITIKVVGKRGRIVKRLALGLF